MTDLLDMYNDILGVSDKVKIRRQTVDKGKYYYALSDNVYILVEPSVEHQAYECSVLDPDDGNGIYDFTISFQYVCGIGNFEDALLRVYNGSVKAIVASSRALEVKDVDMVRERLKEEWRNGSSG